MKKRYYKRYYHKFQSRTIANSIDFQTKEISMLFVMAYSADLKLRVTSYVEEGHTLAQTAAIFNKVHPWSIIHWRKKYKATGNVENQLRRPVNKKIISAKLLEYVKEVPMPIFKKLQKPLAVLLPF